MNVYYMRLYAQVDVPQTQRASQIISKESWASVYSVLASGMKSTNNYAVTVHYLPWNTVTMHLLHLIMAMNLIVM